MKDQILITELIAIKKINLQLSNLDLKAVVDKWQVFKQEKKAMPS